MTREKILVIGASGQIGVELTLALRQIYGDSQVIASDLREENPLLKGKGPEYLTIYMLAAQDRNQEAKPHSRQRTLKRFCVFVLSRRLAALPVHRTRKR